VLQQRRSIRRSLRENRTHKTGLVGIVHVELQVRTRTDGRFGGIDRVECRRQQFDRDNNGRRAENAAFHKFVLGDQVPDQQAGHRRRSQRGHNFHRKPGLNSDQVCF